MRQFQVEMGPRGPMSSNFVKFSASAVNFHAKNSSSSFILKVKQKKIAYLWSYLKFKQKNEDEANVTNTGNKIKCKHQKRKMANDASPVSNEILLKSKGER